MRWLRDLVVAGSSVAGCAPDAGASGESAVLSEPGVVADDAVLGRPEEVLAAVLTAVVSALAESSGGATTVIGAPECPVGAVVVMGGDVVGELAREAVSPASCCADAAAPESGAALGCEVVVEPVAAQPERASAATAIAAIFSRTQR